MEDGFFETSVMGAQVVMGGKIFELASAVNHGGPYSIAASGMIACGVS